MEHNRLEKLIKKFDQDTISPAEEKELREYFTQNKVSPHFRRYQKQFQNSVNHQKGNNSNASGKKFYVWGGVMLLIILVVGGFFLQQKKLYSDQSQGLVTMQDEELALQKTKQTLEMVSELLNVGRKDLVYLKEFNNTRERIINHEN